MHKDGKQILPADLRLPCYRAVLQSASPETYEEMLSFYRSMDLREEKDRISRALGSIMNVELLRKVIAFSMSDEVRAQDFVFVIASVANNPLGRDLSWTFFKENWKLLSEKFQGSFLLRKLVKCVTENYTSEEKASEIAEFFKKHNVPNTTRAVEQSIETVKLNAAWLKRDLASMTEFFENYSV